MAFSCAKVEERAIVDISKATAPVLQSFTADGDIVVAYTPAVFTMDFNEKMATYHTLAMVSVNGKPANVTLSTKNDGSTLTLTQKTLVNALKVRGFRFGDVVSVELAVRGSIQNPSEGITNAFVDSEAKAEVSVEMPEDAVGCPYEEYTEDSNWSVIGKLTAYGIEWNGDLNMWTDGNGNYVAAHVVLKAADEVKFRQDLAWTVNVGGEFGGLDAEFAVAQDGANIKVGADGVYDLYYFSGTGTALVTAAFDPYPEFVEESNWSVIGALSNYGINWDGDITMVSDGTVSAAFGVNIAAADEFKFRQDKAWTVNLGGEFGGLDADFAVAQDGANIKVGAAGVYDLFVDPANMTAKIATPSGLKVSSVIVPEVDKPKAWSLAGTMEDSEWAKDYDLENVSGDTWQIRNFPLRAIDEFKIRADHAWDISLGGPEENAQSTYEEGNEYGIYQAVLGETFAAGDKNISVAADGNYNITLTYGEEPTILIEEYKEFPDALYMIGDEFGVRDWESDGVVEMTPVLHNPAWGANAEAQFWTVRYISAGKGFKFNTKRDWGGDFWGLTTNDGFTEAGGNCTVAEDGYYMIHVDFKNEKVHVEPARIFLIGDATNLGDDAWKEDVVEATDAALFKADGTTLKATALKGGNLRMYAASAISTSAAWTREFNIYDGKIVCRGNGGDQEAVPVLAEQVVTLDFNAGTGSIEGEGTAPAFKPEITVAGDYSGYSWSAADDPKLQGKDGVYMGALVMNGGSFKFVHDGTWIGGSATDLTYALTPGAGDNMTIADGTYFWTVNLAAESPVATALAVTKVGLIGTFNSWSDDVELAFNSTDLTYSGDVTLETGAKFKVRFNGNWDYALGGALDKLSAYGGDIEVAEAGTYKAVVDLNKATVTLTPAN